MGKPISITAIVGSYRKGGIIDRAVDEILDAAREAGAETTKISLVEKHIEFCVNCRSCTQREGTERGQCLLLDDMRTILEQLERSDAIVLASPMNFGTVTALMKRFIERLICMAYWPWGKAYPILRNKRKTKRAVLVASAAAPALLGRWFTRMVGLMKTAAGLLGARTAGVLFIGLAANQRDQPLTAKTIRKARRLGRKLAETRDA